MRVWPRRSSIASCTTARSSTSRDPRGESRDVRSMATWCPRQVPLPTCSNPSSTLTTALLDWKPQCVDHIVDHIRGADDHVRYRIKEEDSHRAQRSSLDLSTGARPETRWGNDALLAQ